MTGNFSEVLELYCNEDAVDGTPKSMGALRNGRNHSGDRSPNVFNHAYAGDKGGDLRRKKPVFLHSNTMNTKELDSLVDNVSNPKKGSKDERPKIPMRECVEDTHSMGSDYLILPEYISEQIYTEVMPMLLVYNQSLHSQISLWREHVQFLSGWAKAIHHFHMPEIHDVFVDLLFGYIQSGSNLTKRASIKCLV